MKVPLRLYGIINVTWREEVEPEPRLDCLVLRGYLPIMVFKDCSLKDGIYPLVAMSHSEFEVCQLEAKLKLHKSQAILQNLQADSFRTLAASHACMSDSHWLRAQWYRLKLETDSDSALHLHYELKTRYHMLQAEQHRERFTHYRWMAIEHGKKAEAHEMLSNYLQSKVAKR